MADLCGCYPYAIVKSAAENPRDLTFGVSIKILPRRLGFDSLKNKSRVKKH